MLFSVYIKGEGALLNQPPEESLPFGLFQYGKSVLTGSVESWQELIVLFNFKNGGWYFETLFFLLGF